MNNHLLLKELNDLKREVKNQKQSIFNMLFNQMELSGEEELKNIIKVDFNEIDDFRTTADFEGEGYTSNDGTPKELITNDYEFDQFFGDFTVFTEKDDLNLNLKVFVSNEDTGEHWVEVPRTETKDREGTVLETFKINKSLGRRVRFKIEMEKIDPINDGTLFTVKCIYQ